MNTCSDATPLNLSVYFIAVVNTTPAYNQNQAFIFRGSNYATGL